VLCYCCVPAHGNWDTVTKKWIPELTYMIPSMGVNAGGIPMCLIWVDMQSYIGLSVSPRVKLGTLFGELPGEAYMMKMRHIKQDEEVVDFRRYAFMEPEENAMLVERYSNASKYIIVEIQSPPITSYPTNGQSEMFLLTTGVYSYLMKPPCWRGPYAHQIVAQNVTRDMCDMTEEMMTAYNNSWRFYFYQQPRILDMFPLDGPAVGGTLISIMGERFPEWEHDQPIIRVVAEGIDQHVDPLFFNSSLILFYTPPQTVPGHKSFVKATVYYAPSRSRFFKCGDFTIAHYDDTRLRWGDVIAISHMSWNNYVLHSETSLWHSGSRQMIVLAKPEIAADTNQLWMITSGFNSSARESGTAIYCGSTMRFMHIRTQRNLHTNFYSALASRQGQVYTVAVTDSGDDWVLQCEPNTRQGFSWMWDNIENQYHRFKYDKLAQQQRISELITERDLFWRPSTVFRLYHPMTQKYLTLPGDDAEAESCAVCGNPGWKELTTLDRTEGAQGETQRFVVKRQTRVPIPCLSTELLAKRWYIASRPLGLGDFVVWRKNSEVACLLTGPHTATSTGYQFDSRFGQVLQVYDSGAVQVEEWSTYNNLFSDTQREISSTVIKKRSVVGIHSVHGPLHSKLIPCPNRVPYEHQYVCLHGEEFCDLKVWRLFNLTFKFQGPERACVRLYIQRQDLPLSTPLLEQVAGVMPR